MFGLIMLSFALSPPEVGANKPLEATPATPPISSQEVVKVDFFAKLDEKTTSQILQKDTEDLAKIFPGIWDSDNQAFFEPALNIPKELRHPRLYAKVVVLKNQSLGDKAFMVEYREGGGNGKLLKTRFFTLSPDNKNRAVKQTIYEVKPDFKIGDINAVTTDNLIKSEGCEINYRRRASGFTGDTSGNCKLLMKGGKTIRSTEHHDIDANFWEVTDIGVDESGVRVYGNLDNSPTKLRKANVYECWASYRDKTISNIQTYDAGGEMKLDFGANSARLLLRNVDWAIGNNRPSLTLYLYHKNDDIAQIYSWTDEGANRIALADGDYQASCTKQ